MTYLQAFVIALIQGVTELFPVSSLGHSVLVPAWFGGSWQTLVTQSSQQSSESSFYLAYIVALHCATAFALMWFFRADWIRIIRGFFRSLPVSVRASLGDRRIRLVVADKDERLAWLIVLATIPVGLTGLLLEHPFRVLFAKPIAAACLLFINGLILLAAEDMRRTAVRRAKAAKAATTATTAKASDDTETATAAVTQPEWALAHAGPAFQAGDAAVSQRRASGGRETTDVAAAERSDERLARLSYVESMIIGASQVLALLAGISRSGITMAGGLWRGLDHEDAARFAFLLATPVILAAGVLKVPSLFGSAGAHIHGQVILGVIVCGIAAYLSVRFLIRWFETRTLTPFAIYCLIAGIASIARFI